ncbi:MAG TPA: hypothetical protein VGJ23_03215 [Gaiellaceae bacterium]|jgi:hypothetical protein
MASVPFSGRQKLGRKGCDGERIPRDKLEAAVIHQLATLYRDGALIRDALDASCNPRGAGTSFSVAASLPYAPKSFAP